MVKRFGLSLGFTLIEMAIVLVIIGLVLSGGLIAVSPVIENSKNAETNQRLDRIEQALILHVITNGCLPCPATANDASTDANAGQASDSGGTPYASGCQAAACLAQGVVPWVNLGISEQDATDGFGTRISYAIANTLQNTDGMVRTPPAGYPAGDLVVEATAGGTDITAVAAYVLISHGADRAYGYSLQTGTGPRADPFNAAQQQANSDGAGFVGSPFVQQDMFLVRGATYFDDLVRWRTAPMIIQLCGSNACGNPA